LINERGFPKVNATMKEKEGWTIDSYLTYYVVTWLKFIFWLILVGLLIWSGTSVHVICGNC